MGFEWDPGKAKTNVRKHGVDFADADTVLEDEVALSMRDVFSEEERWIALGRDALDRVLVVVYMWCEDTILLISARRATPREQRPI